MSDSEFLFKDYSETCPSCNDGYLIESKVLGCLRCTNCNIILRDDFDPDNLDQFSMEQMIQETELELFSDPC